MVRAREDLERYRNDQTSLVGLEAPLFPLRNPGLISVPLGFLAVILGSLLYRDPRALAMWSEISIRQNTGILAARGGEGGGEGAGEENRF
ncbi:MAG: cation/acetate symporter [Pseudomonadota bacterium]|nr:cation/acetate symporter [Pseudomonadota bacterium]